MPGEFEALTGCWMLWPEQPDNRRLGAKLGQRAFAAAAKTVADFETLTMGASGDHFWDARRMLRNGIRVVEMSCND